MVEYAVDPVKLFLSRFTLRPPPHDPFLLVILEHPETSTTEPALRGQRKSGTHKLELLEKPVGQLAVGIEWF